MTTKERATAYHRQRFHMEGCLKLIQNILPPICKDEVERFRNYAKQQLKLAYYQDKTANSLANMQAEYDELQELSAKQGINEPEA